MARKINQREKLVGELVAIRNVQGEAELVSAGGLRPLGEGVELQERRTGGVARQRQGEAKSEDHEEALEMIAREERLAEMIRMAKALNADAHVGFCLGKDAVRPTG